MNKGIIAYIDESSDEEDRWVVTMELGDALKVDKRIGALFRELYDGR